VTGSADRRAPGDVSGPAGEPVPGWLSELAKRAAVMAVPPGLQPQPDGRPAAVLILFGDGRRGPDLLLVQRGPGLRRHSGQPAFPGGAIDPGDGGPVQAALREAAEEAGVAREAVRVLDELHDDHGGWRYITVVAEALVRFPIVGNEESLDLRWVAETEVELLDLHPGFARTWPLLRELHRA
jgi:8-oxo-dGTP pyrophosphatase MutT (NUDIX family)